MFSAHVDNSTKTERGYFPSLLYFISLASSSSDRRYKFKNGVEYTCSLMLLPTAQQKLTAEGGR